MLSFIISGVSMGVAGFIGSTIANRQQRRWVTQTDDAVKAYMDQKAAQIQNYLEALHKIVT